MSYFPMLIELQDKSCVIIGGGSVARRKVEVLSQFGAKLTVVAPEIAPDIKALFSHPEEACLERNFTKADLKGAALVVAATSDSALNHEIASLCKESGIPVNAVDQIEDCSFIFPAIAKQGEVVAAFSSGGQSPVITQYLKQMIEPYLTENLGELAEGLGAIRDQVKTEISTEAGRKAFYREIFQIGLDKGHFPETEEVKEALAKYRG
ncbi:MAG: bifunctional precorrin-2 dehydrogenase/sirohydrochlorin ferrochelatase [Lachnospiraceae bacterium]|nr:bifunctional precorrin-2 dehydrogenase/sirohydrochlorin ferrochelatase [Lachnospiraceae bacterium]